MAEGIVVYRTAASDEGEAINIADNFLSRLLHWSDPTSGEDYDVDVAKINRLDVIDEDSGNPIFELRVPVRFTKETDKDLLGLLEGAVV